MLFQLQVSLAAGHQFDRDVELLLYYQDTHQPTAIVEAAQASAKPGEGGWVYSVVDWWI